MCVYIYIFIHRSSPIGFLLQGIVLPSNPYRKSRLRKVKRCGGGRRIAASYVLCICKPNVATDLPLTKDYPSHDPKPRTKQRHLTLERACQTKSISLFKPPPRLVSSSPSYPNRNYSFQHVVIKTAATTPVSVTPFFCLSVVTHLQLPRRINSRTENSIRS